MSLERDQAIVLRRIEFSETSQIVSVFTRDHGRHSLIAKGARRSTRTRFTPGLDLLELGELTFTPARGDAQLGTLAEWSQQALFEGLRRHLVRLYTACYAVELIDALTAEADPHPELFDGLLRLLRGLDVAHGPGDGAASAVTAAPRFQALLLRQIGYTPLLSECIDCRRRIDPRGIVYFSAVAGGALCRDCEQHHAIKRRLPPGVLGSTLTADNVLDWFDLLDEMAATVAGRPMVTRAALRPELMRLTAPLRTTPPT